MGQSQIKSVQALRVLLFLAGQRHIEPFSELARRKAMSIGSMTEKIPVAKNFQDRGKNVSNHARFLFKDMRVGYTVPMFVEPSNDIYEVEDVIYNDQQASRCLTNLGSSPIDLPRSASA